jgi:hypothetical protein
MQTITKLGMDKVDEESINSIKADGMKLYNEFKE